LRFTDVEKSLLLAWWVLWASGGGLVETPCSMRWILLTS
jgi:hypothetical protein